MPQSPGENFIPNSSSDPVSSLIEKPEKRTEKN